MTKTKTFKSSLKSVGKLKPTSLTKKVKSAVTSAMSTGLGSGQANINSGGLGSPKVSPGFAKGGWIAKATENKGGLHKSLGIPLGKKIPALKMAKAAMKPGKVGKQARLAETLKGFR